MTRGGARVALLGVTPALTQLSWPDGARILAVDANPTMVRSQWRAHPSVPSAVICANWQALPLPDKSLAAVAGDGSLNVLPYTAYRDLFREVARVLAPENPFILRCFIRPDTRGDVEDITQDVAKRAFPNSAPFRLRLCMSLAERDGTLDLGTLLERFNALFPDRTRLASMAGWPIEEVDRFDAGPGQQDRTHLPVLVRVGGVRRTAFCNPRSHARVIRSGRALPDDNVRPVADLTKPNAISISRHHQRICSASQIPSCWEAFRLSCSRPSRPAVHRG